MADDWTVDVDALADAALETELGSALVDVAARQTGDAARPWVRERMLFAARWLQETGRMYEFTDAAQDHRRSRRSGRRTVDRQLAWHNHRTRPKRSLSAGRIVARSVYSPCSHLR